MNSDTINRGFPATQVTRVTDSKTGRVTIFIPLPAELWRESGSCICPDCKRRGAAVSYHDTLAIGADSPRPAGSSDFTYTVHYPELQPAAEFARRVKIEREALELASREMELKLYRESAALRCSAAPAGSVIGPADDLSQVAGTAGAQLARRYVAAAAGSEVW